MRDSFRELKPGGVYVAVTPNMLWNGIDGADATYIPVGTLFLVIEPSEITTVFVGQSCKVLIDGSVGKLVLYEGEWAAVEEM